MTREDGVMDLTEFLLARIAEDEAATLTMVCECVDDPGPGCPSRVLAECEAKRAIVEYHSAFHVTTRNDGLDWDYRGCSECSEPEEWKPSMGDWFPCRTLRALAAVYADHADFRDWWRP